MGEKYCKRCKSPSWGDEEPFICECAIWNDDEWNSDEEMAEFFDDKKYVKALQAKLDRVVELLQDAYPRQAKGNILAALDPDNAEL